VQEKKISKKRETFVFCLGLLRNVMVLYYPYMIDSL
jgi:hypothetical protein